MSGYQGAAREEEPAAQLSPARSAVTSLPSTAGCQSGLALGARAILGFPFFPRGAAWLLELPGTCDSETLCEGSRRHSGRPGVQHRRTQTGQALHRLCAQPENGCSVWPGPSSTTTAGKLDLTLPKSHGLDWSTPPGPDL